MDQVDSDIRASVEGNGLQIHYISDLESIGKSRSLTVRPPAPSDLCTICYSSGTTGLPVYYLSYSHF